MSVIDNTSKPESTLKKKSNSICFHAVRKAIAMGEALTAHIRSEGNPADLATKVCMVQSIDSCLGGFCMIFMMISKHFSDQNRTFYIKYM